MKLNKNVISHETYKLTFQAENKTMNKQKPVLASPRRISNQKNPSNIPGYRANQQAAQNIHPNNRLKGVNNKSQGQIPKKNVRNSNISKIPVKGSNKSNTKEISNYSVRNNKDDQKKRKEMVQLQLIVDPQHVEQMKRSQKLFEDQLKKEIEEKKKQIQNNNNSGLLFEQANNSHFSNSLSPKNNEITIFPFSQQLLEIREEPFTLDLGPESIFDKSTVKTPLPGFSLRKSMNISPKPPPTFPLMPEVPPTNNRLDSASELIYQDGRRYSCPRSTNNNSSQMLS